MINTTVLLSIFDVSFSLLPPRMGSYEARRMLLAIGWQESRWTHRRQIGGPARGFLQFEAMGGVWGVLDHPATREHARKVCEALDYAPEVSSVYPALADNDILAAAFARLNLWWVPRPLPTSEKEAWDYYLYSWRPGKPHEGSWGNAWMFANEILDELK